MEYQMEYKVVKVQSSIKEFTDKVNALIQEGWKPQGGVSITTSQGNYETYIQAMIMTEF